MNRRKTPGNSVVTRVFKKGIAMGFGLLMVFFSLAISQAAMNDEPSKEQKSSGAFLGLNEAIRIAVQKHPSLEKGQHTVLAAEARIQQAKAPLYPQVVGRAVTTVGAFGTNPLFNPAGALLRDNDTAFSEGIVVNQLLFDFAQTFHRVQASRFTRESAEQDLLYRKAWVILGVQNAYYNSLKRQRLVQIAEDTIRVRSVIKQQVEALYKQQLKAKLDLTFVDVELSKAQVALIRARNDLKESIVALDTAMGIQGPGEYTLEDIPFEVIPRKALPELLNASMVRRPEIGSINARIRAIAETVKAERSANFPIFQAIGSAGNTNFGDLGRRRDGEWWAGWVGVTLPLFTGFLIENRVKEAVERRGEVEADLRNQTQEITQQVTNAYFLLDALEQELKVGEALVKQTQEALSLAQARYRLALSSIVELTLAEVATTDAQIRLAQAQFNYKAAEAALQYAVGEGSQAY
jgi:outer membrane protein